MELGRGQEGEVVSTVGDGGADQSQAVPQAGGGQMGTQDHRPNCHWQHVGDLRAKGRNKLVLMAEENPANNRSRTGN